MAEDGLFAFSERKPLEWFEEEIPIRGCRFSLASIKEVYRELNKINEKFGENLIASLERPDESTEDQWTAHKQFLKDDAFRLTVTIVGSRDQQLYGESEKIFASDNLPKQIKSIYFTNKTAFSRHANGAFPKNNFYVLLDFGKPDLTDPNPLVSAATPNNSSVSIQADDVSFFRAVQQVIEGNLASRKAWYSFIHRNFAYDIGVWVLALPVGLYLSTFYVDQIIPFDSKYASYRIALFIYLVGLSLLIYRFLASYAKWAFPVNVLVENQDKALRHRVILGGIAMYLVYKIGDTIYDVLLP